MSLRFALIGAGIAGRARARAIRAHTECTLTAVFRGRFAADLGAPVVPSLQDALLGCDVVCIASPTALHEAQVRAALLAGRHVLVEFPLAESADAAERLFALAGVQERVLHVEHIELLGAVARHLRSAIDPSSVEAVELGFSGPGDPDVPLRTLLLANVARLHRLTDCCGPVASIDTVEREAGRVEATATLRSGAPVRIVFERDADLPRHTHLVIQTPAGSYRQEDRLLFLNDAPVALPAAVPLFQADHNVFVERLAGSAGPYVAADRVLHVLDAVEGLLSGQLPRIIAPR